MVCIRLTNKGNNLISGTCRLLLNSGFEPVGNSNNSCPISVQQHCEQEIALSVRLLKSFNEDIMKVLSYKSVAVCVEFLIEGRVFWLSHEIKPVE